MGDRVVMKRGTSVMRVVPGQVQFWESKGFVQDKPAPKRRTRRKAEQEEGDQ